MVRKFLSLTSATIPRSTLLIATIFWLATKGQTIETGMASRVIFFPFTVAVPVILGIEAVSAAFSSPRITKLARFKDSLIVKGSALAPAGKPSALITISPLKPSSRKAKIER